MTNPAPPDDSPVAPPPPPRSDGWPWPQIGFLTLNIGFLVMAVQDLFLFAGLNLSESGRALSGFLFLVGLFILASYFVPRWISKYVVDKARFSPRLRLCNIGVFGAWVSMLMLTLIIPAIHAGRRAAERERERNTDTWQTIRSEKSPILVEMPSHWVESTAPALAINDVARSDEVNDLHFVLLSVPREDVTYPDLNAWSDAILNELKSSLAEPEVNEKTTQERQGQTDIELRLNYVHETTRLTMLMRFFETPRHYPGLFTEKDEESGNHRVTLCV